jgi:hypothetical protein
MSTAGADGQAVCPGCGRPFVGALALDVHRRHPSSPPACRYLAGELRPGFRRGLYAAPARA